MIGLQRQARASADPREMLRYAGYGGQDMNEQLQERILQAAARAEATGAPAWCYRIFPAHFDEAARELVLEGSTLRIPVANPGAALASACACAAMAATIGVAFDRELQVLGAGAAAQGTLAFLFDTAGSALVESACDDCERAIVAAAQALGPGLGSAQERGQQQEQGRGLFAGQRFSPGYADTPLQLNGQIISVLGADRQLGITATDAGLLVPLKSVTALVPLFAREADAARARRTCAGCVLVSDCAYLKSGNTCYGASR